MPRCPFRGRRRSAAPRAQACWCQAPRGAAAPQLWALVGRSQCGSQEQVCAGAAKYAAGCHFLPLRGCSWPLPCWICMPYAYLVLQARRPFALAHPAERGAAVLLRGSAQAAALLCTFKCHPPLRPRGFTQPFGSFISSGGAGETTDLARRAGVWAGMLCRGVALPCCLFLHATCVPSLQRRPRAALGLWASQGLCPWPL